MIRKITAITVAAACAGLLVTFVPGFAPEVAAGAPRPADQGEPTAIASVNTTAELAAPNAADIRKAVEQNVGDVSRDRAIVCLESWPYYERSCLRDGRHADGSARAVRVIAMDRPAARSARR